MRFSPVSTAGLISALADAIVARSPHRLRVGFDGFDETGVGRVADELADTLVTRGRSIVRTSTRWWWRAAALRLEFGREDPESLLSGWVDAGALQRELIGPLAADGSGRYLDRLRDPERDRSLRRDYAEADPGTVLLLDGPFLAAGDLDLDMMIRFDVAPAVVARALPPDRQWWVPVYQRYRSELADAGSAAGRADVTVAFDHPTRPALAVGTG